MHILNKNIGFPPVETADENGLLAIGGDLSPERLMCAYRSGIFPWYNEGEPIIWYSPPERMVLFPNDLKVSKSMEKVLKDSNFRISFNEYFPEVIHLCKTMNRPGQNGTWITEEMQKAYTALHELGFAKSVEVWMEDRLVGGLYGIDLGHIFTGESMFSLVSNASKVAFIYLNNFLKERNYLLLDCQVYNEHLASLGAVEIPREEFMRYLNLQK
ncbi:MAG: leucyl/phenylalanyl-tRNA--protein transferase [Flavobacteriaceae bacterium]|nr:leucyl/phenylalanyl-tRNA--protein transferase [Flavobacteriaceae bacterium]